MTDARRLPRRDFLLLPLVSLATIALMFVLAEFGTRTVYAEQREDACMVPDPKLGLRYKPDCQSDMKSFETGWIHNHFNACGFRTDAPCGPVPPGTLRVAVLGASVSSGFLVQQDESFGAVAGRDLTTACGRPVQFQPLGAPEVVWTMLQSRIPEAVALKPDAVVMQVAPLDLEKADPGPGVFDPHAEAGGAAGPRSPLVVLKDFLDQSRTFQVAQHFLLRNESLYLPLYLRSGDKSAYMRHPLTPFWQTKLAAFDAELGKVAEAFQPDGTPVMLVFVPQRAEASLAALKAAPPGVEPLLLPNLLHALAAKHGMGFLDSTAAIVRDRNGQELYYPIDGHLNAAGHQIVGDAIAQAMRTDMLLLADCNRTNSASRS